MAEVQEAEMACIDVAFQRLHVVALALHSGGNRLLAEVVWLQVR
jgi:hypothetical protein